MKPSLKTRGPSVLPATHKVRGRLAPTRRAQGLLVCQRAAVAILLAALGSPRSYPFSGDHAFEDLKRLVSFGPRPAGSEALGEARQWIIRELKQAGAEVEEDRFVASTPSGDTPMVNVIAKIHGTRSDLVMLAGHYDTKRFTGFSFVGANDGGSSAAFLLEMARVLGRRKNASTYWLVFFDGEEAFGRWSETDSLYGSRHLARKLTDNGKLGAIKAMILVDMIGDADLEIHRESHSTAWLNDIVFNTARRLGHARHFLNDERAIEDDHIPFLNTGISAIDLIDLDYGPNNAFWHTAQDTVAHCSPGSLRVVGQVVTVALGEIEQSPHSR